LGLTMWMGAETRFRGYPLLVPVAATCHFFSVSE
jgi:hypothetical protein